jgi:hypothetical protein
MKSRNLIFAALGAVALIAAFAAAPQPAQSAQALLCAPEQSAAATGPGRATNPTTGNSYTTNGAGCAAIAQADIGYFRAQGWTFGPNTLSFVFDTGTATTTTDFTVGTLPPGTYIREIIVENKTATSVTGGIGFGTTSGATDIVTALTCGASCLTQVTDSALKLRVFSTTAPQAIHAAAVTTWQGARAIITVIYGYF